MNSIKTIAVIFAAAAMLSACGNTGNDSITSTSEPSPYAEQNYQTARPAEGELRNDADNVMDDAGNAVKDAGDAVGGAVEGVTDAAGDIISGGNDNNNNNNNR